MKPVLKLIYVRTLIEVISSLTTILKRIILLIIMNCKAEEKTV